MTKAKYYIYWNLNRDCYSVKYRGKVIGHYKNIIAHGVEFRVSEKGRARVLREQRKSVHAFVVADKIYPEIDPLNVCDVSHFESVRYNPYCFASFVDASEQPILAAGCVWLTTRFSLDKRKADIKVCR